MLGLDGRWVALLVLSGSLPLAGCVGSTTGSQGVVVTSQPLMDAFDRLDARDEVEGIPDWAIVAQPWNASRVGRPFVIEAEAVTRLGPRLVLDQPHPLVSGPSRQALETGLEQAGIEHRTVTTEPRFSTVLGVLQAAGQASDRPHEPAWHELQDDLAEINETLEGHTRPNALFLFPAGLIAGNGTDVDLVLELAGMENAAAEVGLEGYTQITQEAIRRSDVDLVIATATMRSTPGEIAGRPMFEGTAIEDAPERVLVVDPSRTTRLGPYLPQAVQRLATWSHPSLPGPRVSPVLDPYEVQACQVVTVESDAPNATVHLLGEQHEPGRIQVPDVDTGHYRVRVTAHDQTGKATLATTLSVEGSDCAG